MIAGLTKRDLEQVIAALAIGLGGGAVFWWLGFPAPWLAGSVVTVAAASLSGVIKQAMPRHLTKIIFILLGLQIGGAVTPETLNTLSRWPLSFIVLALTMVVLVWSGVIYFPQGLWLGPGDLVLRRHARRPVGGAGTGGRHPRRPARKSVCPRSSGCLCWWRFCRR